VRTLLEPFVVFDAEEIITFVTVLILQQEQLVCQAVRLVPQLALWLIGSTFVQLI
jgi:hypothetical protein